MFAEFQQWRKFENVRIVYFNIVDVVRKRNKYIKTSIIMNDKANVIPKITLKC